MTLLITTGARADVGVSNLGTETGSAAFAIITETLSQGQANSFTTGPGAGYLLESATLDLLCSGAGDFLIGAGIHSNSGGVPGSLLSGSSLLFTRSGAGSDDYTLAFAGLTLAPETTYWLSLNYSVSGLLAWSHVAFGETSTTSGLAGWSIGPNLRTDDGSWSTVSGGSGLFSIEVQAVPEPSTIAFLGLGVAALALFRRRKA